MSKIQTIFWCIVGVLLLIVLSLLGSVVMGIIERYEDTTLVFFGGLTLLGYLFVKFGFIP